MRERYGLTDVRKAANRMNFNQPEEEYMDGEDTVGLGMLGKEGSGRLRVAAREQKQKMSAKTAKKYAKQAGYKSGLQTSGLASLAFTPVQVRPSVQGRKEVWPVCTWLADGWAGWCELCRVCAPCWTCLGSIRLEKQEDSV